MGVNISTKSAGLERQEELVFNLTLDLATLNEKEINNIIKFLNRHKMDRLRDIRKDGTLDVNYTVDIDYYGGIVSDLDIILMLLNKKSTIKVGTEELKIGRCLIQEILCKLEKIEEKYKELS